MLQSKLLTITLLGKLSLRYKLEVNSVLRIDLFPCGV